MWFSSCGLLLRSLSRIGIALARPHDRPLRQRVVIRVDIPDAQAYGAGSHLRDIDDQRQVAAERLARPASEWLAAARHREPGEPPCPRWPIDLSPAEAVAERTATDHERIRCYGPLFDPDILEVQEVDGKAALSWVAL